MPEHDIPDGFDYVGDVYRPPGEAHNILIQATIGCSHGGCTFCSSHLGKRFDIKSQDVLERDLRFAERYCTRQDRVFVMDSNALCMPMERWLWLLENIRIRLPWVRGVGAFATGMDIAAKSDADLQRLRELDLDLIYLGVESGDDKVLEQVCKGIDAEGLRVQGRRAKQAGMALNISVLIGIVDARISLAHAQATGRLLSDINPEHITILTLIPQKGTVLHGQLERGEIVPPDRLGLLRELKEMLIHTELDGGLFDYSHSTTLLPFRARLLEDKDRALAHIDEAIQGNVILRQEAERHI
ncbi:radical SAM protein [Desulfovibrio sp. OttesenSCG-928-F20]|nr:radical SAM protein [Desulfovibrio sp. OttesenSCG-928-F20]